MKKLKIQTKKDWGIAFIFSTLVIYASTNPFSSRIQAWLLQFGNPKLTNLNQPASYGNVMITVLVLTVLTELLLILYRKSLKYRLIVPIAGLALSAGLFAGYLFNCDLIVSVMEKDVPAEVSIGGWGHSVSINLTEEEKRHLIRLCETLQPVSPEKDAALKERFYQPGVEATSNSIRIWISYPPLYGHNFSLIVCVYEDMIFVRKGYGNSHKEIVTFFEDNGILELLDIGQKRTAHRAFISYSY